VQADAVAGHGDLSRAFLDARRDGTLTPDAWDVLDAALIKLEGGHQRWKTTHHSLTSHARGGSRLRDDAGVPYLRKCLDNRLFWRLGDYLDGSKVS
jgi:tryptophan 2,3-dioxygenase